MGRTADRCAALQSELDDERDLRDHLILEAIDAGHTTIEVSRSAGITPPRVNQIVAHLAAEVFP